MGRQHVYWEMTGFPMLHVVPVPPTDLPCGQEWIFVEIDCELYVLLSEVASGASMERGLAIALGLLRECQGRQGFVMPEPKHRRTVEECPDVPAQRQAHVLA